jgi:tetratricopeptide (TPR) repeat protein
MPDAYCQMAHYYFLQKDHNSFTENLSSCAEKNGLTLLNWTDFLAGIEYRYYEDKELNKLLDVYKILLPYQASDPSLISKMALIYYESGDLAMAEKTANMLLEIDPSYQSEVSAFIEQLKNGKK